MVEIHSWHSCIVSQFSTNFQGTRYPITSRGAGLINVETTSVGSAVDGLLCHLLSKVIVGEVTYCVGKRVMFSERASLRARVLNSAETIYLIQASFIVSLFADCALKSHSSIAI